VLFKKQKPIGFRKWLTLENLKSELLSAAEDASFPDKVYSYLSAALEIPIEKLKKQPWENTVQTLMKAGNPVVLKDFPILRGATKNGKAVDWDYPERTWVYYSHVLAKAYGWTLEYIADLEVNEAIAHLQEVFTENQLENEFAYSLSEIAYPYNKSSKKSEFKPMERPYWMKAKVSNVARKVMMRKSMLPVGNVQDVSGMGGVK
jgi:hypothetical protein